MTMRDQYIIAQALVVAIKALEEVPAPHKELSNIADMKFLLETKFADMAPVVQLIEETKIR